MSQNNNYTKSNNNVKSINKIDQYNDIQNLFLNNLNNILNYKSSILLGVEFANNIIVTNMEQFSLIKKLTDNINDAFNKNFPIKQQDSLIVVEGIDILYNLKNFKIDGYTELYEIQYRFALNKYIIQILEDSVRSDDMVRIVTEYQKYELKNASNDLYSKNTQELINSIVKYYDIVKKMEKDFNEQITPLLITIYKALDLSGRLIPREKINHIEGKSLKEMIKNILVEKNIYPMIKSVAYEEYSPIIDRILSSLIKKVPFHRIANAELKEGFVFEKIGNIVPSFLIEHYGFNFIKTKIHKNEEYFNSLVSKTSILGENIDKMIKIMYTIAVPPLVNYILGDLGHVEGVLIKFKKMLLIKSLIDFLDSTAKSYQYSDEISFIDNKETGERVFIEKETGEIVFREEKIETYNNTFKEFIEQFKEGSQINIESNKLEASMQNITDLNRQFNELLNKNKSKESELNYSQNTQNNESSNDDNDLANTAKEESVIEEFIHHHHHE